MSGLNPFRPRKSEDLTVHQHQPHSSPFINSTAPDPVFLGHPSTATVATDRTNLPPSTSNALDLDDSATSDDQYSSDPFNQDADASDDEAEQAQASSDAATTASRVLRPPQGTIRTTSAPDTSSQPSTTTGLFGDQNLKTGNQTDTTTGGGPREGTAIADSFASRELSALLGETDSDSTADESQPYVPTKISGRPVSLGPGIDPRALATRSGNRGKVPPPPPKSHHGKLISSDMSIAAPASQATPGKAANRVSFHGPPPGPSVPRILQAGSDYFGTPSSQSEAPADALRRSQSQHKRPPTPPLSRRHSQMRRSKSSLSKSSSFQMSAPNSMVDFTASTPSSPGSRSLTPSLRSKDSGKDTSVLDEASSNLTLPSENIAPTSLQATEASRSEIQPSPRTTSKRGPFINHLPPPPPPRRTRGIDNNRPPSFHLEQRVDGPEKFVSHPSNAQDILADLSRLQKEVDDLRGHYENRRAQ
ncbi:hypothetical protein BDW62DRAFT_77765 [Aspergillus aurantiobrunneus]